MTQIFNKTSEKQKRRDLRKNSPAAERLLWTQLRGNRLNGYKFRRQYGIDRYVVDFYCPALRLAIEIDGDSHYWDHAQEYDAQRQAFIEALGIRFLRFTNTEVYQHMEGVIAAIENTISAVEGKRQ